MKKYISFFIIALIFLWIAAYSFLGQNVKINPQLEKVVLKQLEVKQLSNSLIESIESLDLSSKNLTSIEGLQHFTGLKELKLRNNLIEDATPLQHLKNLEVLDLRFNQLTDLVLESDKLKKLDVEGNKLTSLEFVSSLNELESLNVRDNYIEDLTPLETLKKIKSLNIRNNQVKSLDSIAHLTKLQDLNARNNQITSVEPIVDLPLEKRVTLQGNPIIDYHLLADVVNRTDETDIPLGPTAPVALTPSGFYEELELKLEAPEGHKIYYTLDGSTPTLKSMSYTEPILLNEEIAKEQPLYANIPSATAFEIPLQDQETVKKAVTVTAISFMDGQYSEPVSYTYFFDQALLNSRLPIVSITINPKSLFDDQEGIYVPGNLAQENSMRAGNYGGRGRDYERKASFEYFNADGTLNTKQNVGVRIHGNYSRALPQKSLRLYSRAEYGQSRFYANFFEDLPYDEHKLLLLRNSGNDNNSTMMRDGLMQELVKDRKIDVQAYQPTIVLINGEYWGIHNLRERYNEDYVDIKYNVKPDELAMMTYIQGNKIEFEMDVGIKKDERHFQELIQFIRENDLSNDENLDMVYERIDVESFFDYAAAQVYFANTDSFHNNLMMWRKKVNINEEGPYGHDGRWRWMLYDTDFGMGYRLLGLEGDPIEFDMIEWMLRDHESVLLFRELMNNEKLKRQFTMTLLEMLENNFEENHVHQKINEFAAKIRPEMPRTIERWGSIESMEQWEENIDVLHQFAETRPSIVKEHIKKNFGYSDQDLLEMKEEIAIQ